MFSKSCVRCLRFYKHNVSNFQRVRFKHEWTIPSGYDTGIKIYNRITNKNVPLIFMNEHFVKWYICGPTVYDSSHVGHASCYIRFDIIRRILEKHFNIRPIVALGITDVDDKIIKKANLLSLDWKAISKQHELDFFKNLNDLNILPPSFVLRVTDHIPVIIDFVSNIINKGHAYLANDGSVYFNTELSKNYGKLNPLPKQGSTPLKKGQKCYLDFALWKGSKPNEPFWEAPWGKGRPGWHIECSAMASYIFGSKLDLHSGGIDLVFPHHENEEAQSCSFHDCDQWVNYWLHAGELQIEQEKMSKSLKNFISINEFLKTYSSDHLRMFCFVSKYERGLHYSSDSMAFAVSACNNISQFLMDSESYIKGNWSKGNVSEAMLLQEIEECNKVIVESLKDNFNTAACYNHLAKLVKNTLGMINEEENSTNSRCPVAVAAASTYVREILQSFGFKLGSLALADRADTQYKLDFILDSAINFRQEVREEALTATDKSIKKNLLKACDSFRENLGTVGIVVKDQGKNLSSYGLKN